MLLRAALAGLLLLGGACGEDDLDPEDAGVDGGHDAGRDLGTDAGPRDMRHEGDDAAIDGGPDDRGWEAAAPLEGPHEAQDGWGPS